MILLIARKELRSLFLAPATWLILSGLFMISSLYFLGQLNEYLKLQSQLKLIANAPGATYFVASNFFYVAGIILMILTPIFSMRLLAEERRSQTLPLLLSAPLSSLTIILGKFLGLLLFLWLIVLASSAMVLTLSLGTTLDFGLWFTNTCGLLLLATSYTAIGLYFSVLSSQPVVAAISALALQCGLWLLEYSSTDGFRLWTALAPTGHFHNFSTGLIDSLDVVYFLVLCVFFLLLSVRRLDNIRIYG